MASEFFSPAAKEANMSTLCRGKTSSYYYDLIDVWSSESNMNKNKIAMVGPVAVA
jgi:hypothetical protein